MTSKKKYNVNMLNIGQDDFAKFEKVKAGLYFTAVGICFNQMSASKGIKLYRAKAIEGYFPGLVVERGKNLKFLEMEIGFLTKGKLLLGLVQYITGMIEDLEEALKPYGENLDRVYPHPAVKWLFTVKSDTNKLVEEKADIYRNFVAKLIWVIKRGRPDVETTVSFLSTRVKKPNKDDWHKFKRLMCWIKKTKNRRQNYWCR